MPSTLLFVMMILIWGNFINNATKRIVKLKNSTVSEIMQFLLKKSKSWILRLQFSELDIKSFNLFKKAKAYLQSNKFKKNKKIIVRKRLILETELLWNNP